MKTYSPVVPINYAFLIRPKLQMQFANNTNPSLEPARLTHIYLKYFFLLDVVLKVLYIVFQGPCRQSFKFKFLSPSFHVLLIKKPFEFFDFPQFDETIGQSTNFTK